MSVTVIGLDKFLVGIDTAKASTKKVVEAAALNMALQVRRLAQDKVPKRSSTLAQSIVAEPIAYGAMTTVGEKYGVYVEEGTGMYDPNGAHLIYPTTSKVMVWEEGGQTYGAHWTRGMEAQPYWQPALDETDPFVEEQMAIAAETLIQMAVKA